MQRNLKLQSRDPMRQSLMMIESKALFGAKKEVLIHHEGAVYRLKITRFGKLILNK
ncbi:hemin uptake protein HemP [Bartonella apis]|uniref:hemin uptake protein HemP n=1 Tax=Bartonella apis TaxID=1686310 RepID=UPI00096A267B|nr:hemin uptake protein HemP [Bartonella apis]MCT6824388.1 hemin uptake protein HemP [Bartonella apis]MCT6860133.1 hemin uptake protein HemP [Bartonella apis]MCT6886415.1 hemin uptake protein HemP [Bartonella apis]